MTGTDLCVRLYKSVPVIFEPPCISLYLHTQAKERKTLLEPAKSFRPVFDNAYLQPYIASHYF